MDDPRIFAISRPHAKLMTLYLIRSLLTGPGIPLALPLLFFRYHTLRYRFDDEGITMSWGILFRREVRVNYARIQDIHVTSGILQRWLGLADLQIQTASGSSAPEMTLEGLLEYEAVRDHLYQRMRGTRDRGAPAGGAAAIPAAAAGADEAAALLGRVLEEMRGAREAIEALARERGGGHV